MTNETGLEEKGGKRPCRKIGRKERDKDWVGVRGCRDDEERERTLPDIYTKTKTKKLTNFKNNVMTKWIFF